MSHTITVRKANVNDAVDIAEFNLAMAWETEEKKLNEETIG